MTSIWSNIKQLPNDLIDLLFPSLCAACSHPLNLSQEVLCLKCRLSLPLAHINHNPINHLTTSMQLLMDIDRAYSWLQFVPKSSVQQILHHIKYRAGKTAAEHFGKEFALEILQQNPNGLSLDAIIPVPLHPLKLQKRGYNQAEFIARGMSEIMEIPLLSSHLQRIEHKSSQTKLKRFERFLNAETVYQCKTLPHGVHQVLLVDDVITSGSTMQASVTAIKKLV
jgi:ComF family protein